MKGSEDTPRKVQHVAGVVGLSIPFFAAMAAGQLTAPLPVVACAAAAPLAPGEADISLNTPFTQCLARYGAYARMQADFLASPPIATLLMSATVDKTCPWKHQSALLRTKGLYL